MANGTAFACEWFVACYSGLCRGSEEGDICWSEEGDICLILWMLCHVSEEGDLYGGWWSTFWRKEKCSLPWV